MSPIFLIREISHRATDRATLILLGTDPGQNHEEAKAQLWYLPFTPSLLSPSSWHWLSSSSGAYSVFHRVLFSEDTQLICDSTISLGVRITLAQPSPNPEILYKLVRISDFNRPSRWLWCMQMARQWRKIALGCLLVLKRFIDNVLDFNKELLTRVCRAEDTHLQWWNVG